MHREDHEGGCDASLGRDGWDEIRKGKEGGIAAAHEDGADRDDTDHDKCQAGCAEAGGLSALDHGIDGACGGEAFREEFAGDDDGDDIGELLAHAIEEDLDFRESFLQISCAEELGDHADGGPHEHCHDDVHLDAGDAERREDEDESERNDRKDGIDFRRMGKRGFLFILGLDIDRDFFWIQSADDVSIAFIHDFLREVVGDSDTGDDSAGDRDLEGVPVDDGVEACDLSGKDGAGVGWAPVQAERGRDGCGRGNAGDAECDEDREHGHHEEHGQAGGAIDGQPQEHAEYPAGAHDDVGRFQKHQRADGEGNQRIARADLIHIARKAADGHDVQTETGEAVCKKSADELKNIEAPHACALSGGEDRTPAHDHGAREQQAASYEKDGLWLVLLQNEPSRPYDNECSE